MRCTYARCDREGSGWLTMCREHTYQAELILIGGLEVKVQCGWCGENLAAIRSGRCKKCQISDPCVQCGAPRTRQSTTGLCGVCWRSRERELPALRQQVDGPETCDACRDEPWAKGLCKRHYYRKAYHDKKKQREVAAA